MLDFDLEFIEIKFKGALHKVSRPTNKQIKQYTVSLKANEGEVDSEKVLVEFLETLGLKSEVYEELTPQQVRMVLKELYDTEKN